MKRLVFATVLNNVAGEVLLQPDITRATVDS
jgi:hypothetical protein